jgi:hypothetical protein
MNVKQLRLAANHVVADIGGVQVRARWCCEELLRILDAFEAMEREGWQIWNWVTNVEERNDPLSWSIEPEGGDGPCIVEAKSPLEALLAAAQTLETKTDG